MVSAGRAGVDEADKEGVEASEGRDERKTRVV
jgi:hypothetical protein